MSRDREIQRDEEVWERKLEEEVSSWGWVFLKPGASDGKVSWDHQGCKARSWPMARVLQSLEQSAKRGTEGKRQSILETKERHRKSWSF